MKNQEKITRGGARSLTKKGKIILLIIVFLSIFASLVLRHSYALFERNIEGNKINFVVGKLNYNFILDEDIEKGIYVKGNGYKVVHIELNSTNDIESKYVFVYKTTDNVDIGYIEDFNGASPSEGTIDPNETKQIYLAIHNKNEDAVRLEISVRGGFTNNNIEVENNFKKITEKASETYKDSILNGADPLLGEKMVPITIDDNGTVHYASLYSEWYNYSSKNWANAVILVDKPSKEEGYHVGEIISEEDIQSYFVWIPRYKYKIWNLGDYTTAYRLENLTDTDNDSYTSLRYITGNAQLIDIVFQNKGQKTIDNKTTECAPDNTSGGGNNCQVDYYMTHPAFTLGTTELDGIWVGKFETGYNQNQNVNASITTTGWSIEGAQRNEENSSKVIVKPNVYSWRNIMVGNIFKTALNYKQDLGSHMMKNTEWGAVAYLSHSVYGIGNEVNINNSNFKTGYSATANTNQNGYPGINGTDFSTTQPYNTSTGYLASTTGNITGIYDMAGGAHEYMASYMENYGTNSSGFDSTDLQDYTNFFDIYLNNNNQTSYNNRILGDATGEMGPFYIYYDKDGNQRNHNSWFADHSLFVETVVPWFYRGGLFGDGILAGQFHFNRSTGDANTGIGSRLVLTGKKEITS